MTDQKISDDGQWIWDGQEWVPVPPTSAPPQPINEELSVESSDEVFDKEIGEWESEETNIHVGKTSSGYKTLVIAVTSMLIISATALAGVGPVAPLIDNDMDSSYDWSDNCPKVSNSDQFDYDEDGLGNECDDDDDNDGSSDAIEIMCMSSSLNVMDIPDDFDNDGTCDFIDDDDDNDGWLDSEEENCNTNQLSASSVPADFDRDGFCDLHDSDDDNDGILDPMDDCQFGLLLGLDTDGDGCKNSEDDDDDDDGFLDLDDRFPLDDSEWEDFDEDGIGNNADIDDDNDGIIDSIDYNDRADVGIRLSFDEFRVITEMDYFDSYTELYICMYMEGNNVGCGPGNNNNYWSLQTSVLYSLDTEIVVDVPDNESPQTMQICAWDQDSWEDDRIDINPLASNNCEIFYFDITMNVGSEISTTSSGEGDGAGWDGEISYSYELIDLRFQRFEVFMWDYDGNDYSIQISFDYDTYSYFKNLDHTITGSNAEQRYGRFPTPSENYVIDLANSLESMAISSGYNSELEIAEFVFAFVGDIQYVLDIEGTGESNYAKYPIEMLWEASGDCEDASILYSSLIEALGYDALLMRGLVKEAEDEDWGGHVWVAVHIPNHPGPYDGWYGTGAKSETPFYFVETTAHRDGVSQIGRNPWYDLDDVSAYDVE